VNVHFRSAKSATDTATSIEAVQEFLQYHQNIENVALFQCTSVFLEEEYLTQALALAYEPNVECVFAVIR
jgi:N-acylneuraminate/3-deoxy-D-glycero-D-galacto-nononate cytidylyltransferase